MTHKVVKGQLGSFSGFMLLEIIVALALVSGVLIAVITGLNYHLSAAEKIDESFMASVLARQKAEEMLLYKPEISQDMGFSASYNDFVWEYDDSTSLVMGLRVTTNSKGEKANVDVLFP